MSIDLLLDTSSPKEVSIAVLKDKKLIEFNKEPSDNNFCVGDIYLGKIKKVVPSLNAAFVDVGFEKDAFLHYHDLGPQFASLKKFVKLALVARSNSPKLEAFENEPDIDKDGKITKVLSSSLFTLVQIVKEPISTKGPRLCSEITLAGRYLVLIPFSNRISVSQKIKNYEERDRLKRLIQSIKPNNFGIIIRTVAQEKKVVDLDADLKSLVEKWKGCIEELKGVKTTKKVLGEIDRTSAMLRDMLSADFSNIHVNSPSVFYEIKSYISSISPDKEGIVKLYNGKLPIFENYGIHKQIKASFGKYVSLSSGSYLVIEHTEAMHVVDVNSGSRKSVGKSQEENALETNLEAAEEIARQLRLRDMGGIIVADFIDMQESSNRKLLYEKFKEFLREDRAKNNILPVSKFGIIEITRQRVRPETAVKTNEVCPCCNGSGEVQATILIVDEISNAIRYLVEELHVKKLMLVVHPFLHSYLKQWGYLYQIKWYRKYKRWVVIQKNTSFQLLEYRFINDNGDTIKI